MTKRKLHINGEIWHWHMGGIGVVIYPPNGNKKIVRLDNITGMSHSAIEHDQDKKNFHLGPQDVKDHIMEFLL